VPWRIDRNIDFLGDESEELLWLVGKVFEDSDPDGVGDDAEVESSGVAHAEKIIQEEVDKVADRVSRNPRKKD
jgi:hypothetical protein